MRTPTRTDLVDAHLARIQEMRDRAIDYRTAARAFSSLADHLSEMRSEGSMHDEARKHLRQIALIRRDTLIDKGTKLEADAALLEEQGLQ